jgi:hypothetical protein
VRDRDRLRQQVLELRGWQIHRVWSTDWFHDRETQMDRLVRLIEDSKRRRQKPEPVSPTPVAGPSGGASGTGSPTPPSPPLGVEPEDEKPSVEEIPVATYRMTETPEFGQPEDFYQAPEARVAEAINRVVRIEGPIYVDELVRRVAAHWGLKRAGKRISDKVTNVAGGPHCSGSTVRRGEFFWPTGMERPPVRSRDLEGETFDSDHICEEETAEAVRLLLRHRAPLLPEEIVRETTRVLGFKRAGKKLQGLIQHAVEHLVERGELRAGGTGIRLAG